MGSLYLLSEVDVSDSLFAVLLSAPDADSLIRQRSKGKRSLDDFARVFFGMRDRDWGEPETINPAASTPCYPKSESALEQSPAGSPA